MEASAIKHSLTKAECEKSGGYLVASDKASLGEALELNLLEVAVHLVPVL